MSRAALVVVDCDRSPCRRRYAHRPCTFCGTRTCNSKMRVDPDSLRRRKVACCTTCYMAHLGDDEATTRRTQKDWLEITDPLRLEAIRLGEMPEQYPSTVRTVLRAFYESTEQTAVVEFKTDPASLNQAIASLGLYAFMYAEQRSGQIVLRRLQPTSAQAER